MNYDHEKIDLWLHEPELLCNPDLWKNPDTFRQQILMLEDDTQAEIPEQEHVVHIIDQCIVRYSTHKQVCKTIAIFLVFCQFWIAMLCTKHWQTETDWKNHKHHVEREFLQNRIDQDINISVFELNAAKHEIIKHVQWVSFRNGFMRISRDVEN